MKIYVVSCKYGEGCNGDGSHILGTFSNEKMAQMVKMEHNNHHEHEFGCRCHYGWTGMDVDINECNLDEGVVHTGAFID